MEISQIEAFVTIAKEKGFSRAATFGSVLDLLFSSIQVSVKSFTLT